MIHIKGMETKKDRDHLKEVMKHLKDDGNDGHKLYVIAEMLFEGTKQLGRIADYLDILSDCVNSNNKFTISDDTI